MCQGSLGGVRVLAALGGRLFSGLFRRADAITAAMTARGFVGAKDFWRVTAEHGFGSRKVTDLLLTER